MVLKLHLIKTLLFVFLQASHIHGQDLCPPSFCGGSTLNIKYPFALQTETHSQNCTYIDLHCNATESKTAVSLPLAGDFYVENIYYAERAIQLYDPDGCLMRRIMNFSLDASPFRARYSENYTFYGCPWNSTIFEFMKPIECLSNSTYKTVATFEASGDLPEIYLCSVVGYWVLPVREYGSYDESFMFLTWDSDVCAACEDELDAPPAPPPGDAGPKPIIKIIAIVMSMPALILMALSCCSVFCLHLANMIAKRNENVSAGAPSAPAAPETAIAAAVLPPYAVSYTGLDESKIKACTKLVVLNGSPVEGMILSGNNAACSICLENFGKRERMSVISKCGHCFHATCIHQWLGKNGSCPVCRTSLSDAAL